MNTTTEEMKRMAAEFRRINAELRKIDLPKPKPSEQQKDN